MTSHTWDIPPASRGSAPPSTSEARVAASSPPAVPSLALVAGTRGRGNKASSSTEAAMQAHLAPVSRSLQLADTSCNSLRQWQAVYAIFTGSRRALRGDRCSLQADHILYWGCGRAKSFLCSSVSESGHFPLLTPHFDATFQMPLRYFSTEITL